MHAAMRGRPGCCVNAQGRALHSPCRTRGRAAGRRRARRGGHGRMRHGCASRSRLVRQRWRSPRACAPGARGHGRTTWARVVGHPCMQPQVCARGARSGARSCAAHTLSQRGAAPARCGEGAACIHAAPALDGPAPCHWHMTTVSCDAYHDRSPHSPGSETGEGISVGRKTGELGLIPWCNAAKVRRECLQITRNCQSRVLGAHRVGQAWHARGTPVARPWHVPGGDNRGEPAPSSIQRL